jgi:hypothetical protein
MADVRQFSDAEINRLSGSMNRQNGKYWTASTGRYSGAIKQNT